jgi:hypothetical protein
MCLAREKPPFKKKPPASECLRGVKDWRLWSGLDES